MKNKRLSYQIRQGRRSDLQQLWELEQAAFSGDRLSLPRLRHWLQASNGELRVAAGGGELLGYGLLLLRKDSRAARLYSLAVAPSARGQGVASALVAALEAAAKKRGCGEVRLEVASRNAGAIALYQRLGYREFGRRADYYDDGDTALRMCKAV
jgi:ribosomal protein S18 acetylase RimI-like enzyme